MSVEAQKQKQLIIDEIKVKLENAKSAVVIDYLGITVAQADAMRKKLRELNVDYSVYKNTLVKRAIVGTAYEQLEEVLEGPSAFAFSYEDPTLPAKTLNDIIKEYKKMAFKAGIVDGTFYDAVGIQQIASIPSREELLAKFLGSIQSPVSKMVRTFQAIADAKSETGAEAVAKTETVAEAAPEAVAEVAAEAEAAAEAAAAEAPAEATEAPTEEATEAPAEAAAAEAPVEEAAAEEAAPEAEEATEAPAEEAAEAPAEEAAAEEVAPEAEAAAEAPVEEAAEEAAAEVAAEAEAAAEAPAEEAEEAAPEAEAEEK